METIYIEMTTHRNQQELIYEMQYLLGAYVCIREACDGVFARSVVRATEEGIYERMTAWAEALPADRKWGHIVIYPATEQTLPDEEVQATYYELGAGAAAVRETTERVTLMHKPTLTTVTDAGASTRAENELHGRRMLAAKVLAGDRRYTRHLSGEKP